MTEILLSSEAFIKSVSSISDNVAGKYILPSLREAQEVNLREILGDKLLEKLKKMVADHSIDMDEKYKALLDKCQYYLAYCTIVEILPKVTYKVGNFGVTKSSDENLQVATQDEVAKMQYYYQSKADSYCLSLQNFIINHHSDYPEITECHCKRIHAHLTSAASCGIFLGGARGRRR